MQPMCRTSVLGLLMVKTQTLKDSLSGAAAFCRELLLVVARAASSAYKKTSSFKVDVVL